MACSLKTLFVASWSNETLVKKGSPVLCRSSCCMKLTDSYSKDFMGKSIHLSSDQKGFIDWNVKAPTNFSVHVCNHSLSLSFVIFKISVIWCIKFAIFGVKN